MYNRILVIDDSKTLRMAVKLTLEALEFEIVEAIDGLEGLNTLEALKGEVDLILLDWFMPKLNGQETLDRIMAHEGYKSIPVVMLTTATDKDRMINAIRAGARHYITKPFTSELLLSRIVQTLGLE